ncbi:MAG TPA: AraC family transcriptional regulator [Clostridia bacterium]|nr:AraC family transcriptional regulator [Clostridia bacterium]
MVLFKSRRFVEGENQFDFYHFVMPRVEVPSFFADSKEIDIPPNTILATNPGQRLTVSPINKKYSNSKDIKFISLFIEPNKLRELSKSEFNKTGISFFNNTSYLSNNILTLISKFEMEYRSKQAGYQFILDCLSIETSINLMRELRNNMSCMPEHRKYSARREINTVIDYLWENVNMEFSLDKLCSIVNLSPYYFMRLFKDYTGKTPYEYYIDIKISRALEYLKTKKYSITEICFILGFSSHSHFTSVFRKRVGRTPSEFIKSIE